MRAPHSGGAVGTCVAAAEPFLGSLSRFTFSRLFPYILTVGGARNAQVRGDAASALEPAEPVAVMQLAAPPVRLCLHASQRCAAGAG